MICSLPINLGQGVLAKSTSNVVITFLYPSFPSRDYTPCYGPLHGDLFFLSLDEPGGIFVRMHGCITMNNSVSAKPHEIAVLMERQKQS